MTVVCVPYSLESGTGGTEPFTEGEAPFVEVRALSLEGMRLSLRDMHCASITQRDRRYSKLDEVRAKINFKAKWKNLERFQAFYLRVKAIIWPRRSSMFHILSREVWGIPEKRD